MTTPLLLGLMGQKRSGKDSLASFLTAEHGFQRLAFADRLKAVALASDPRVRDPEDFGDYWLSSVVRAHGWEGAKEWPDVRAYLQNLGVAVRDNLGDETWIRPVIAEARTLPRAVVTDVRFPNEAAAIREAGGKIVRVDRPGLPDEDGHVSEHAWRAVTPDAIVANDRGPEDLRDRAATLVSILRESLRESPALFDAETDYLDRLAARFAASI